MVFGDISYRLQISGLIPSQSGIAQSKNLYAHCLNNPLINVDLDGKLAISLGTLFLITAGTTILTAVLADPNLNQALGEGVTAIAEDFQHIGQNISTNVNAIKDSISGLWDTTPAAVDSIPNTAASSEQIRIMDAALTPAIEERDRILASMNRTPEAMAQARDWARQQVGTINQTGTRNHTVYIIQDITTPAHSVWYVGRTIDYTSRQRSHQAGVNARFPERYYRMSPIATTLTESEARALEQTLITAYTLDALNNKINSIAERNWDRFSNEFKRLQSLITRCEHMH